MKKIFKNVYTADVSYLTQAPTGIPGDVTRVDESNVEPAQLIAASGVFPAAFGIPMKYVTGGIQQFNGGAETAPSFAGVLIREVPGIGGTGSDGSFAGVPYPSQIAGLLVRGYCSVVCAAGTPARGGVVYVQVVAGTQPVGSFRADGSDSGNAVALTATQAEWASDGLDANKNAEIRVAR
jgi:hypothetical protein